MIKDNTSKPAGDDYLRLFVEKSILPSIKKQSSTIFFIKGLGRNSFLKYISVSKKTISEKLGIDLANIVLLTIDSSETEIMRETWIRMLREQEALDEKHDLSTLSKIVDNVTNRSGKRILLCVWVNEEGVNHVFLESLRMINPMMIDFQFSFPFEIEVNEIKNYLGPLTQFAIQNIWYMPLYGEEDIKVVINNQIKNGFSDAKEDQFEKIIELSGGYPRLARFFLRNPEKIDEKYWNDPEVNLYMEEIWDGLSESSKKQLFSIVENKENEISAYAKNTKIVDFVGNNLTLFSPIFDRFVRELHETKPPTVFEKNGKIVVSGDDLESLLSDQEVQVFNLLFKEKGKVVTRDSVASAVWGDGWEDKYSDWAIDQIISRIRRKIGDRSQNSLIKTKRGKGFILQN